MMTQPLEKFFLIALLIVALVFSYHGYLFTGIALCMVFLFLSYKLTHTPHGQLDYLAALSLNFLTFKHKLKPDPGMDFHLPLPVNLLYPLSSLLPNEPVSKTEDLKIKGGEGEIPARVYWPKKSA